MDSELSEAEQAEARSYGRCWRCGGPTDIVGAACRSCRPTLYAERERQLKASGRTYLYLPEPRHPAPIAMPNDTKMCVECAREFEIKPGPGRKPVRCPKCRADAERAADEDDEPKPRTAVAKTKRAPLVVEAIAEEIRTPGDLIELRRQVGSDIEQLERQLGIRLRLLRALDEYFSGEPT